MPIEAIPGVNISPSPSGANIPEMFPTLEEIATSCVKHLREGGYMTEVDGKEILTAYLCSLTSRNPPRDFLYFAAEVLGTKHSLAVDAEVGRMQRVLRGTVPERVHFWTFGPLPGRSSSLYELCPRLRAVCSVLGCPAVIAGETSIIHVVSINPLAVMMASKLISQELAKEEGADGPFIFPFLVDLPAWNHMLQRHFA